MYNICNKTQHQRTKKHINTVLINKLTNELNGFKKYSHD
ncbi:MAG: hypothetical protein Edafosvirus5_60 [Edafosvirus sp.]|uniref:Uncharacterized protein n=1 Tax=Edafosvirus sp. TaxID=2487765 RepID=A0A3G4ZTC2_9VIRU|nr:MAG: hypothetical protein Edafosvirus5_60 [Edafosvirus sp.]